MKRLQNRIAESWFTLPWTLLYGIGVWLAAGLVEGGWWLQAAIFIVSVYLMVELANANMLIRIYSRSIAVMFIALTCTAPFLFPSLPDAIAALCTLAAFLTLCNCYQDKTSVGWTYYTFLILSLGTLTEVRLALYVPLFWLLMGTAIYSLSWRTLWASVLGLLTPYWALLAWFLYMREGDLSYYVVHFAKLTEWDLTPDYGSADSRIWLCTGLCVILGLTGFIHFLRNSFHDKIRVRQIYYSLASIGLYSSILLILQPADYRLPLRLIMMTSCVLFGHFWALTQTKLTNIACCTVAVITTLLTALQLWML